MNKEEKALSMSKGGLHGLSNEALEAERLKKNENTIVVNEVPADFDAKKGLLTD